VRATNVFEMNTAPAEDQRGMAEKMHQPDTEGLRVAGAERGSCPPDHRGEAVADVQWDLMAIMLGGDAAYHALCAIERVQAGAKSAETVSGEQRDTLLAGVALVQHLILDCFARPCEQAYAREGIDALRALIMLWAEAPEVRALRPGNFDGDMRARARWLHSACLNTYLRQDIKGPILARPVGRAA
jgi:hypothetical protein